MIVLNLISVWVGFMAYQLLLGYLMLKPAFFYPSSFKFQVTFIIW